MQLLKTFLALHIKVKKHNFHAPLLNKRESFIESLKKIINLRNSFLVNVVCVYTQNPPSHNLLTMKLLEAMYCPLSHNILLLDLNLFLFSKIANCVCA